VALRRGICSDSLTHVSKGRVLFFQLADIMSIILGRVERLLGRDCSVNPYPLRSEQWMAFQEGWVRDFEEPVIDEICKQNTKRKRLDRANRVSLACGDTDCQH
jgi:hypothetical protein